MKKQNVRTLSFIVSTFTYLLVGAAIFDALESQAEEYATKIIESNTTSLMNRYNITDDDYQELELLVKDFHQFKTHTQWEFLGAFYFSLTVITTIGEIRSFYLSTFSFDESFSLKKSAKIR